VAENGDDDVIQLQRVDVGAGAAAEVDDWVVFTLASFERGHADGPLVGALASAQMDDVSGLAVDAVARVLYVADARSHVVRAVDLDSAELSVSTVAGTPQTRGFLGDGGPSVDALLFEPRAVGVDSAGNLFIAESGNHRVRRVDALGVITTVLGDGTPASSGDGAPAREFPVDTPLGLAVDPFDNLFVTSRVSVREVSAGADGVVAGDDDVRTIYGAAPRAAFPESVTRCLTGIVAEDAHVFFADRCAGLLIRADRGMVAPPLP
jgi:hypothetical protein